MAMNEETRKDMQKSNEAFTKLVWPAIKDLMEGGNIVSVESVFSQLAFSLDVLSGIDLLQIRPDNNTRGIASRVQFTNKNLT